MKNPLTSEEKLSHCEAYQVVRGCNYCAYSRYFSHLNPRIRCTKRDVQINSKGWCLDYEREPGIDDDI